MQRDSESNATGEKTGESTSAAPEKSARPHRVLIGLLVLSVLYTAARYTYRGDLSQPPYSWRERAAWWLPRAH